MLCLKLITYITWKQVHIES